MLCFFSVDTLATGSKAVGGSLQRYHSVAFAVSRSVSRDLSWHGIGLDEPHQSLKCKKMFYDLTCIVKSRRKYALSQYQMFWSKKGTQERIKKQNNKTEGRKGEVENSLSFEATKWEKKKNHIELTLTQERLNSPKEDTDHSFQPKGCSKTSNGTAYVARPFARILMPSISFWFM